MKKTLSGFRFLAISLFMVSAAMAADGVAAAIIVPVGEAPWWKGLLNGFMAGAVAVFYGYAKNKDPKTGEMEGFDIKYAFPTLIVGGLIGIISVLIKASPQDLATSLATSPIYGAVVFAAESLLKAVFRHSVPWIRDAIGLLKTPPANPTASPEDKPPTQ